MGEWLSRARREWLIVAEIIVVGLFAAGDSAGVIEELAGREAGPGLVALAATLTIGMTALARLVNLRRQLERYESRVRLVARPGSLSWNHPDPGPGRVRLRVHVQWELWTDIDIRTSALGLSVVGIRSRKWWQVWTAFQAQERPLLGLRVKGQDTPDYRKTFMASQLQPIQDSAEFEYEGSLGWDGDVLLALVLKTGSPEGRFTSVVDPRLWDRGSMSPL